MAYLVAEEGEDTPALYIFRTGEPDVSSPYEGDIDMRNYTEAAIMGRARSWLKESFVSAVTIDNPGPSETCSICMESYEDHKFEGAVATGTHSAVKTVCGHVFGASCLWTVCTRHISFVCSFSSFLFSRLWLTVFGVGGTDGDAKDEKG